MKKFFGFTVLILLMTFTIQVNAQLTDKVEQIDPQDGIFVITYTVEPSQKPIDAAIGIGENPAAAWGDFNAYVRLKPVGGSMDGYIDARNGLNQDGRGNWIVEGDTLSYEARKEYTIRLVVNLIDKNYTASVMPEDSSDYTVIGTDLGFRADGATINYVSAIINNTDEPEWIGTIELSDVELSWEHHALSSVQKEPFSVEFDAVPEAETVNCVIGLTDTTAGQAPGYGGYRDMGPIVRFNAYPSVIDVRNGGAGYTSDVSITYEAGKSYHFRVEADPVTQMYDVFCRPEGDTTIQIADDYAFRRNVSDSLVYWVRQHDWTESEGVLDISNFAVMAPELEYVVKASSALKNDQAGSFQTTLNLTPSHSPMDGVVGLSQDPVPTFGWSYMAAMVRFSRTGFIDVRNGDGGGYGSIEDYPYEAGVTYAVTFDVNMLTKKYSVMITPEGGELDTLAIDYDFRVAHPAATLGYVNTIVVYETEETLGSWVEATDILLDWENYPLESVQKGTFTATFDATPESNDLNAVLGFSENPTRSYGSFSPMFRFKPAMDGSVFDARNGSDGYMADETLVYEGGITYHIRVDVNVVDSSYSVTITPEGADPVALATDYKFRAAADSLAWSSVRYDRSEALGEVDIENFRISSTGNTALESYPLRNPQTGSFVTVFKATSNIDLINATIALGETENAFWSAQAMMFRFKETGFFDVRDGDGYNYDNYVTYTANTTYEFTVDANVIDQTYSVFVKVDSVGAATDTLAIDYAFRPTTPTDTINYVTVLVDYETESMLGGWVEVEDLLNDWENWALESAQVGSFTVEFDAVPESDDINAVIGMSEDPTRSYGSFSPMFRFKPAMDGSVFDARNGSDGYMADATIVYTGGLNYHFKIDVDVATETYDVTITPENLSPITLATGYGFRNSADILSWASVRYDRSEALGEVSISNFTLDFVDAIGEEPLTVIRDYELSQNYPNPFNPSTTINFALPKNSEVRLLVFDILGQKVAELVNERMDAGRHSVTFNASNYATGLYFYRLQADNRILVKKMMLIK